MCDEILTLALKRLFEFIRTHYLENAVTQVSMICSAAAYAAATPTQSHPKREWMWVCVRARAHMDVRVSEHMRARAHAMSIHDGLRARGARRSAAVRCACAQHCSVRAGLPQVRGAAAAARVPRALLP
jgi:hypothetical protein